MSSLNAQVKALLMKRAKGAARPKKPAGAALLGGCCPMCMGSGRRSAGAALIGGRKRAVGSALLGGASKRPGAANRALGVKAYAARNGLTYKEALIALKGMDVTPSGEAIPKVAAVRVAKAPRAKRSSEEKMAEKARKALESAERKLIMKEMRDASKGLRECPPYRGLVDKYDSPAELRQNLAYVRAFADPRVDAFVESL